MAYERTRDEISAEIDEILKAEEIDVDDVCGGELDDGADLICNFPLLESLIQAGFEGQTLRESLRDRLEEAKAGFIQWPDAVEAAYLTRTEQLKIPIDCTGNLSWLAEWMMRLDNIEATIFATGAKQTVATGEKDDSGESIMVNLPFKPDYTGWKNANQQATLMTGFEHLKEAQAARGLPPYSLQVGRASEIGEREERGLHTSGSPIDPIAFSAVFSTISPIVGFKEQYDKYRRDMHDLLSQVGGIDDEQVSLKAEKILNEEVAKRVDKRLPDSAEDFDKAFRRWWGGRHQKVIKSPAYWYEKLSPKDEIISQIMKLEREKDVLQAEREISGDKRVKEKEFREIKKKLRPLYRQKNRLRSIERRKERQDADEEETAEEAAERIGFADMTIEEISRGMLEEAMTEGIAVPLAIMEKAGIDKEQIKANLSDAYAMWRDSWVKGNVQEIPQYVDDPGGGGRKENPAYRKQLERIVSIRKGLDEHNLLLAKSLKYQDPTAFEALSEREQNIENLFEEGLIERTEGLAIQEAKIAPREEVIADSLNARSNFASAWSLYMKDLLRPEVKNEIIGTALAAKSSDLFAIEQSAGINFKNYFETARWNIAAAMDSILERYCSPEGGPLAEAAEEIRALGRELTDPLPEVVTDAGDESE